MELPLYALVGSIPVCVFNTDDGGSSVQAWDPKQGAMCRGGPSMRRADFPMGRR